MKLCNELDGLVPLSEALQLWVIAMQSAGGPMFTMQQDLLWYSTTPSFSNIPPLLFELCVEQTNKLTDRFE